MRKFLKFEALLFIWLTVFQIPAALAQSSYTDEIWTVTIEGGTTSTCWPLEKAKELCGKKPSRNKLKKISREHYARIVKIEETGLECQEKKNCYRCRKIFAVTLQKRRDFTFEESTKMHMAEELIKHALPGIHTAEAILKAHNSVYGAIMRGTVVADYAKSFKQSIISIKRIEGLMKKLRDPSEEIVFEKVDTFSSDLRQASMEMNTLYLRLPPEYLKKLGFPATGREMFEKGNQYLKSGQPDLARYWFELAAKNNYPVPSDLL